MRAKMLVEARIIGDPDRLLLVGQEVEGADAELQVGLGHAEPLPEPEPEPKAKSKKSSEGSAE